MINFLGILLIIIVGISGFISPKFPISHWFIKAFVISFVVIPFFRGFRFVDDFLPYLITLILLLIVSSSCLFLLVREKSKQKKIKSMFFGMFFGFMVVLFSIEVIAILHVDQWLLKSNADILKNNIFATTIDNGAEYYRRNCYYFVVKYDLLKANTYNPLSETIKQAEKNAMKQEHIMQKNIILKQDSILYSENKIKSMNEIMKDYIYWKEY